MRKLKLEELERVTVETFKEMDKIPVIVILDDIRSMHNIGSIFRSADAFLIQKIYLCGITAKPPHKEIRKTALGATESVDWEYVADIHELIDRLKNDGFQILSVEQTDGSQSLEAFSIDGAQKIAVIFGNEVEGVQQSVIDVSDGCLEIPQAGTKHSLNVSVCAGVVLWEFFKNYKI